MNRILPMTAALTITALSLQGAPSQAAASGPATVSGTGTVAATVSSVPLQARRSCGAAFLAHPLPHTTTMRGGGARFYDSNGSGLGVGDLNGDGLLDAVLGNLAGTGTILWNLGGLRFRAQPLEDRSALASEIRDVKLVDVNADGRLDITLTHSRGGIGVWLGRQGGGFTREWLSGARTPAYTMQWDDLSGAGELNLITGSYDAALEAEMGSTFLFASNGGVAVYGPVRADAGGLSVQGQKLAKTAHTLALLPFDLDGDGTRELVVGNDFGMPDRVWKRSGATWAEIHPFGRITRNTMGFSSTDMDNDGVPELFATDMKPDFADPAAVAIWTGLLERTYERLQYRDIQRAENTLQVRHRGGTYRNVAYDLAMDSSGWSWSAQFGDLDNDGFEDLYVVNGMIDEVVFKFLKGGELVERNRAYRNTGRGRYALNPGWKLDSTASGRSMALADFDNDGRLDVLVNNVGSPAALYENQLCGGGALEVNLKWSGTHNLDALGATVLLRAGTASLRRDVRSGSGYLSGTPARVHFGLAGGAQAGALEVVWPDGLRSVVPRPPLNTRLTLTRTGGVP
ncbi:FG-GAP-like repeat-containing protein [Deinococcus koreensis]|uniref:CRTAC1 family protein n=1 Tax=Deinococcus koreensis TaxID=2054903 RepID=A0A2K3V029_9DEIO|nr:FG-GAP-like repeat-containing protein [Deinococcus koreensis]PNY82148.1 CRTAC1 family protein [Deinococcus koreensis]